jgi:hypothetical protein
MNCAAIYALNRIGCQTIRVRRHGIDQGFARWQGNESRGMKKEEKKEGHSFGQVSLPG